MNAEGENRRHATVARVLLENIGGFLAFAGVIASSGMIMERIGNQGKVIDEVRQEQKIMARDVSEIKGKIAVHDAELDHLKGRDRERYHK